MHNHTIERFKSNLAAICGAVLKIIADSLDPDEPLTRKVVAQFKPVERLRLIDEILSFGILLLSFKDGAALKNRRDLWPTNSFNPIDSHEGAIDYDILLMEFLSSAWIALYFLCVPFPHMWERVRRWEEDEGGQLPSGACISKATGDIYREERVRNRHMSQPNSGGSGDLSVLTHCPAALFWDFFTPSACKASAFSSFAPDEGHILARCYELLQLRLYCKDGLSLRYFVPASALASKMSLHSDKNEAWNKMISWLRGSIFTQRFDDQYVHIIDSEVRFDCIINSVSGIYTYEELRPRGNEPGVVFPGTYFREPRRVMYKNWLKSIDLTRSENLITCNDEALSAACNRILKAPT